MGTEPFTIDYTVRVAAAGAAAILTYWWRCPLCSADLQANDIRRHTLKHRADADR